MTAQVVTIGDRTLRMTNLDRVMYPDGTTKAEVLQYLLAVSDALHAQLRFRLLTRKRWPHGVDAQSFFEKNLPKSAPAWIPTTTYGREPVQYPVMGDADVSAQLAYYAQAGVLEFHVPQWTIDTPGVPNRIVLDLDPGPGAGVKQCCEVALLIAERLAPLDLTAQPVLSGSKGLQLYIPLTQQSPVPLGTPASAISDFVKTLAQTMHADYPKLVQWRMAKEARTNSVFLDWSQNSPAKTTIAPYSPRGTRTACAAAPVTWDEVRTGNLEQFGLTTVRRRLAEFGDLLQSAESAQQAGK